MIFEKPIFTDVDQHLFPNIVKPTSANIRFPDIKLYLCLPVAVIPGYCVWRHHVHHEPGLQY